MPNLDALLYRMQCLQIPKEHYHFDTIKFGIWNLHLKGLIHCYDNDSLHLHLVHGMFENTHLMTSQEFAMIVLLLLWTYEVNQEIKPISCFSAKLGHHIQVEFEINSIMSSDPFIPSKTVRNMSGWSTSQAVVILPEWFRQPNIEQPVSIYLTMINNGNRGTNFMNMAHTSGFAFPGACLCFWGWNLL